MLSANVLKLLAFVIFSMAVSQNLAASMCSCRAADGSCSASITCSGGCFATCGAGGNCSAGCSNPGDPGIDQQYSLTYDRGGLNANELSQALSEHWKQPILYLPNDRQETLTFDFKQLTAPEVRHVLAKRGVVVTASKDQTHFSLEAANAEAENIAEALKEISSGRFELFPRDPHASLSLDVKDLRLSNLARVFSKVGTTRLSDPEK